ncbi:EF-hand domain-containing protein [uncultured Sphingomonas sp.]|uniref:EF-hand domain-containing protein n=1 Tax=uncultured Sphingomonas sp. TaxID=158754 RepID=UPI0035CAF30B
MWRYVAGVAAAVLLVAAGMVLQASRPTGGPALAALSAIPGNMGNAQDTLPETVPEASAKTREEKRFGRYDKNRDGSITRAEYLTPRQKAFAKLDRDGNGMLSFDEWAIKAETKFATADADKSGAMSPAEFTTTAVKRNARTKPDCPSGAPKAPTADGDDT